MPADASPVGTLAQFDTCTVSDACDALGTGTVLDGLLPLWEGARVCGPVVTVELAPVTPGAPAPAGPHLGARAIERAACGDVILVANEARTGMGGWGGLLARGAMARGVVGVVVDGACRDADEARSLRFPVFARAAQCRTARGRVYERACGEPVTLNGHLIRPGDVLTADGSGVVVVPAPDLPAVVARCRLIARKEELMASRLAAGEAASDVLGADYESMLDADSADPSR
jgi:regulator of RNase E activity RraA